MADASDVPTERLFLCDCGGSMPLDAQRVATACNAKALERGTLFCRREAKRVEAALEAGDSIVVACGQEAPFFTELAEELGAAERLRTVDIRDRAGWSSEGADAAPKMAALLADAAVTIPPTPAMDLTSDGACLIYGPAAVVLEAAALVAGRLSVTVMATDGEALAEQLPPATRDVGLTAGRIASAKGVLGDFELRVSAYRDARPDGRAALRLEAPRDGVTARCDLIVDLSGGAPLFSAHEKRDGYLRADPTDPTAVARILLQATALVGTFEKPFYVAYDPVLCARSRASKKGCERCLQVCPTSAIAPAGEGVKIDPLICAGCGACSTVCPSGAVAYAYPAGEATYRRLQALFDGWRAAGGGLLRLLIHDGSANEMIAAAARFGRGLPANVVPFALNQVTQVSHALLLAALAMGASEVVLHLDPRKAEEAEALRGQVALALAMTGGLGLPASCIHIVETADPDVLESVLHAAKPKSLKVEPVRPLGDQRGVARLAMTALAAGAGTKSATVQLPADIFPGGPPYGAVTLDVAACTLCLSCVSLCPAGALVDNPDRPQLRFVEDRCLQCGICRSTCPENAITLTPRYLLGEQARQPVVLKEEEPFACISCSKPFGVRSTVERISEKLAGKHWMFADDQRVKLIQMCDDCRIRAQYHSTDSPFRLGERPKPRSTEDYLREREEAAKQAQDEKDPGEGSVH